jgi:hypothetical protein
MLAIESMGFKFQHFEHLKLLGNVRGEMFVEKYEMN